MSRFVVASDPDGAVLSVSLPQTGNASPTLKVAQPLGSELGTHQHYLNYFLGNSPPADIRRVRILRRESLRRTTGQSDPFLVILNDGLFEDENPGQLLAGALAINNAALLAGDYNHDDRVDAADYVLWRKTVGSTSTFAADGTGDKVVDLADYNVWRHNFGLTVPASGLSVGSVPEPTRCAIAGGLARRILRVLSTFEIVGPCSRLTCRQEMAAKQQKPSHLALPRRLDTSTAGGYS